MRKIWLIGTASSGADAPYNDRSWEIWGVAMRAAYVTRADRWFELHRLDGEPKGWADNWRKTIKQFSQELDLYMFYPESDLGPRVVSYPYDRITKRFGTYFMTSSFAWMMALAIDELRPEGEESIPGEIGISGVDMEYGTEYRQQRVGFRHFVDLAGYAGIPVSRLASTGLSFEPVPYPLWQDDPLLNKLDLRSKTTREQIEKFEESIRHTRTMIAQNRAVIDELERQDKPGYDRVRRLEQLFSETEALLETSSSISKDIVHWTAIEEEQDWLRDYLNP